MPHWLSEAKGTSCFIRRMGNGVDHAGGTERGQLGPGLEMLLPPPDPPLLLPCALRVIRSSLLPPASCEIGQLLLLPVSKLFSINLASQGMPKKKNKGIFLASKSRDFAGTLWERKNPGVGGHSAQGQPMAQRSRQDQYPDFWAPFHSFSERWLCKVYAS